jgi:phenylalanine ammonia-lyase
MSNHLELVQHLLQLKGNACQEGHSLDGYNLTLGSLIAVSRTNAKALPSDKPETVEKIHQVIEELKKKLKRGEIIYGINTGYGGSADTLTDRIDDLQTSLRNSLSVGFRGHLAEDTIRATICIRANSLMRGNSAIRLSVIENMCTLLNKDVIPLLPKRASVSASGDLIPLAYLAAFLEGAEYSKGSCQLDKDQDRKILPATEALKHAGISPEKLQPKEVLAIVNGTSASAAEAGLALGDAHILMLLSQVVTALNVEAMKGTKESFHSFIHESRPHPGQIEVARNILHMLEDSKLCKDYDQLEKGVKPALRQDRYSLRTTPQWLGPQLETMMHAHDTIEIELNSTTDNPIIDPKTGKVYHGGNFQGTSVAVAMENIRIGIQHIGKLIYAQHLEIINKDTNRGLPANLAFSRPSLDYGMKGVEISMASYMAELSYVCNTVTNHVHSTDLHNQNINSVALISARATKKAIRICQMMFAAHIYALLQAIDLRIRDLVFFEKLREGVSVWMQDIFNEVLGKSAANAESIKIEKERLATIACLLCQENQNVDPEARFAKAYHILFSEVMDSLSELGCSTVDLKTLEIYRERMIDATLEIFNESNEVFMEKTDAKSLLGKTYNLYKYFREEKELKMNRGTAKDLSHGEVIAKIHEAIRSWEIVPVLMECVEGANDTK